MCFSTHTMYVYPKISESFFFVAERCDESSGNMQGGRGGKEIADKPLASRPRMVLPSSGGKVQLGVFNQ